MSDKWMTIDSAPKDGRKVLLWQPGRAPYLGSRDADDSEWWTDEDWANDAHRIFPPTCEPTHWMPIPPAPKDASHD